MKVGSLVVVKKLPVIPAPERIEWLPVDDESTPYVIRNITRCAVSGDDVAHFEEGIIGFNDTVELGVPLEYLREVQSPDDLESMLSEVQECCEVLELC